MIPITFNEGDFRISDHPHHDAFIATANVNGFTLHNILIDNGSSIDILFFKAFDQMGLNRRTLDSPGNALFGFGGSSINAIGKKTLKVAFAEDKEARIEHITFDIVDMEYPYMAIFGKPFINKFDPVIRQNFLCMKMPSPFRVITVFGDQKAARKIEAKPIPGYNMINEVKKKEKEGESDSEEEHERVSQPRAKPTEETEKVQLSQHCPDKCVYIGKGICNDERTELIEFLNDNREVFAWQQTIFKE